MSYLRSPRNCRCVLAIILMCLFATLGAAEPLQADDGIAHPVKPEIRNHPLKSIWSGQRFSSETARALQNQGAENPANAVLADGSRLWRRPAGPEGKSCRSCHNSAAFSMRSVGTRYPRYYRPWKKPMSLEQRINLCRTAFMQAEAWREGSRSLIAMTMWVQSQSRRMPVQPKVNGRAAPFFAAGKRAFYQRIGQANMSCAVCHEKYPGKRLGAQTLSQGQSNGFPAYILSFGTVFSLHQQFQQCNLRVGAEPLPLGSGEYVNLELYLAWRGQGLLVETPAVRD